MQNSIKIENVADLTKDVLDALLSIENDSFDDPWSPSMFRVGEQENIAVMTLDGHMIGYLCYLAFLDECHILNIAVSREYRQQGLGGLILDWVMEKEERREIFYLEVRQSNKPAIQLYEKKGFKTVGIRKKYYKDGEDAYVMGWQRGL